MKVRIESFYVARTYFPQAQRYNDQKKNTIMILLADKHHLLGAFPLSQSAAPLATP